MRIIDADALLTERRKTKYYHLPNGDIAIPIIDIEHAPTVEPEPRWISCSERMPQKEVDVLCCRGNKTIAIMHFNPVLTTRYPKGFSVVKDGFSWEQDNVVAWMPLPEPYREDKE